MYDELRCIVEDCIDAFENMDDIIEHVFENETVWLSYK
jgi:hypothetical protein